MRAIFLILIIAVVALILAVMTGFINLRQTEPADRKSTRLNSSHLARSRMPSSA